MIKLRRRPELVRRPMKLVPKLRMRVRFPSSALDPQSCRSGPPPDHGRRAAVVPSAAELRERVHTRRNRWPPCPQSPVSGCCFTCRNRQLVRPYGPSLGAPCWLSWQPGL